MGINGKGFINKLKPRQKGRTTGAIVCKEGSNLYEKALPENRADEINNRQILEKRKRL